MSERAIRRWQWVGFCVAGVVLGASLRSLFPPFVLDDQFWRSFWSGPPVAGLFAVVAATIAFYPAFRSSGIARESAAREQWWNRAEWALGLAVSDTQADRVIANDALTALFSSATEMEAQMIFRTVENLQGSLDTDPKPTQTRRTRRLPWQK